MAHRWSKPIKNKRRIDPRYFLDETATRGEELEEGYREDEPEASDPWSYERKGPGSKKRPAGGPAGRDDAAEAAERHRRRKKDDKPVFPWSKEGTWGDGIEPEEILEEEDPESEADELLRLGGYDKTGKKMGKGTKTKRAGARRQASQEDPAGEDIEAVEAPQLERGVNR